MAPPKGFKHSKEAIEKIKKSLIGKIEEKNRSWKGEKAGYQARHIRLRKKFGNALICENKKNKVLNFICSNVSIKFNWAKKKNRNYTINKEDYYQLCASCHLIYDRYYKK